MKKMFAPERRNIIMLRVNENKRVTIKELSKEINVSEATLRMDLAKMEEEGLLLRTHGGAIILDSNTEHNETSFNIREGKNKSEKTAIAKKAADLVSYGQCILLDASSTALELARILCEMQIRLTVVTSGIKTALQLNESPDITVILLGGIVKKGSFALEGSLGLDILKKINIDLMFTSANGFSIESGLTDFSVYEVELKKDMVKASKQVIALLDHTKINKNSIATFATVNQIDAIITDADLENGFEKKLTDNAISLLKVTSEETA